MKRCLFSLLALVIHAQASLALTVEESALIEQAIDPGVTSISWEESSAIKAMGPDAVAPILEAYAIGDEAQRAKLASLLYRLKFKNEKAKELLLRDVKTQNPDLRISVQYALGTVSNDQIVVKTLLDNMRNDGNAFFRDKAACALAYDQPHLDNHQKYYLYRGLIDGLSDDKQQVRNIAIKALKIHTGQTMGYSAAGGPENREAAIAQWNEWLREYQQSL